MPCEYFSRAAGVVQELGWGTSVSDFIHTDEWLSPRVRMVQMGTPKARYIWTGASIYIQICVDISTYNAVRCNDIPVIWHRMSA